MSQSRSDPIFSQPGSKNPDSPGASNGLWTHTPSQNFKQGWQIKFRRPTCFSTLNAHQNHTTSSCQSIFDMSPQSIKHRKRNVKLINRKMQRTNLHSSQKMLSLKWFQACKGVRSSNLPKTNPSLNTDRRNYAMTLSQVRKKDLGQHRHKTSLSKWMQKTLNKSRRSVFSPSCRALSVLGRQADRVMFDPRDWPVCATGRGGDSGLTLRGRAQVIHNMGQVVRDAK